MAVVYQRGVIIMASQVPDQNGTNAKDRIMPNIATRLLTLAPRAVSLSSSLPFKPAHRKQRSHPFESDSPAV